MYNILVTGGAGYLGSIMVPALLAAGHKVTVVDNFMFKQVSLAHCCSDPNFSVVRGDVRDMALMKRLLVGADVVIPLAALVGAPLCKADPFGAESINLTAQIELMKALSPNQRVLMPITNSGYGIGESGKFCTEETPMRPISLYGIHKVEVEKAVLDHSNSISFRLATVFGMAPRPRLDLLVNDFVYRAVYDRFVVLFESHFKRNFIHVRDVTGAFMHGLTNFETMKNRPYNVGLSSANLSKWELCEVIKKHLPDFVFVDAPMGEDPDKRDYIVSNERLEATGWAPQYDLDKGVVDLIKGYTMLKNTIYTNI
ncbi:NAD-dependent epimerase/dehydratase family protein [Paramagnetospirillum magneticum]|uniref:Nucleoside-diphosphate-sugar epimerase n=1 Tax=Paramagnetospirillum magneticum (strain ATCC 700264 / AMB-1) TaxID=342108 RepID=Q2W974_PARM1|nr:SDR family oxidoreductase [Paramagnetospirillum magneticum]BAE49601.1 Nucleoside-diphosphate-sugar epimerase [Paramagnetospirillum magneticum AMB-1]